MESEATNNGSADNDRESYVRWQEIAITQLGYTINLLLTFAGATLAFAVKTMMESKSALPCPARLLFHASLPLLGTSIVAALAANMTRAQDFRNSRRAARARMVRDGRHDDYQHRARVWGEWTWGLFYAQTGAFMLAVLLLGASMWLGYGNRI